MRKLNHYIARTVVAAVAVVLLVIVAMDSIFTVVEQLGELEGNYNQLQAMYYVLWTLPHRIYEYIPFSALVGCLIGMGLLANSSELVVMRAAGVSIAGITWSVVKPVLFFIGLGLFLGEYVTPYTEQIAESGRALAQGDKSALESKRGLWNREGDEFMHFNAVLPNGVLFGVTRYQFDPQGRLLQSSFARRASFQGDHWLEEDSIVTRLGTDKSYNESFATRRWNTDLSPALLNVVVLPPEDLAIGSIYRYALYLDQQELESSEYWLAFWQKVLQPFATTSLVIIAISFIFGPLRQVTTGYRVVTGVIVGVIFQMSQDLLGPSSVVFGFSPLVAVIIPILLCFIIGALLLRRAN